MNPRSFHDYLVEIDTTGRNGLNDGKRIAERWTDDVGSKALSVRRIWRSAHQTIQIWTAIAAVDMNRKAKKPTDVLQPLRQDHHILNDPGGWSVVDSVAGRSV